MVDTRRVAGGCVGVCLLGVLCVALYSWKLDRWIERELHQGLRLERELFYCDELESMTRGWSSSSQFGPGVDGSPPSYIGPSLDSATSPDGCYTVFTGSFLYDHHSYLRNESTGEVTPLLSIREPDPWSGSAHGHHWSADSQAVYFVGQGCDREGERVPLPLIYLLNSGKLIDGSR